MNKINSENRELTIDILVNLYVCLIFLVVSTHENRTVVGFH